MPDQSGLAADDYARAEANERRAGMRHQATEGATPGPTLDADLYSFATMQMERRAQNRIAEAIDTQGLSTWFGEQLRHAYQAGLRDGYVQGRHDRHRGEDAG